MIPAIQTCTDGPTFSRLVFGLWRLADWGYRTDELLAMLHRCLALGVTTMDHADIYGDYSCEALFGEALAQAPGLRQQMQLVTKCDIKLVSDKHPGHALPHYDTSKAHIMASVENSLRRLHTDHIDVLLLHRPDPLMEADEVAEAFAALRDAGKVLHFGVSNFTPAQYSLLASRLPFPLVTNQVECSVLNFDVMHDGTLDQSQELRIAPMAWSPLGGGRLFSSQDAQAVRVRACLETLGEELGGATLDQVAYAWLLKHPARIIPVLGTGKMNRVEAACDAAALVLTRQQWFKVWQASKGHNVP
ncbi:MAG: aldo/keto reductase [Bacteroidota bacterium]